MARCVQPVLCSLPSILIPPVGGCSNETLYSLSFSSTLGKGNALLRLFPVELQRTFEPFQAEQKVMFFRIQKGAKGSVEPLLSMLHWAWAAPRELIVNIQVRQCDPAYFSDIGCRSSRVPPFCQSQRQAMPILIGQT